MKAFPRIGSVDRNGLTGAQLNRTAEKSIDQAHVSVEFFQMKAAVDPD